MPTPLVTWWIDPTPVDEGEFQKQVLRRVQYKDISSDYKTLTQQQVDDVITCAASIFFRGQYSLDFEYIDLPKGQSLNAFNSGVVCFFPPATGFNFELTNGYLESYSLKSIDKFKSSFSSQADTFLLNNFKMSMSNTTAAEKDMNNVVATLTNFKNGSEPHCPYWYDPRCRTWWTENYE
jgi:hypothetical protein